MNLNDRLFELGLNLAKYPGSDESDALNRRVILRKALAEHGDQRYAEGYHDGRRDMSDAKLEARQRAEAAEDAAEASAEPDDGPWLERLRETPSLPSEGDR